MSAMPNLPRQEMQVSPEGIWAGYSTEPIPLKGYAALVGIYLGGTVALLAAAKNRSPRRIRTRDIVLLGVATHKLTRIITKDWVTSPLRAPFTKYVRSLGGGEQSDTSRGSGMQRAVGDLLTCPWCTGPWVATSLIAGLVFQPRLTRMMTGMLAAVTISDYLHHAWDYTRAAASERSA